MAGWVTEGWSFAARFGQKFKGVGDSGKRMIDTVDLGARQ